MSTPEEWIQANKDPSDPLKGRGKCKDLAGALAQAFPELRLVVEDRPVGVCMECGDDVFRDSPAAPHFCSKECGDTYGAYCF